MFGPRLGTVFASRWKALLWSAGILLTAYCTVPSRQETQADQRAQAAGEELDPATKAALEKFVGHRHERQSAPRNPWARDPAKPHG